MTTRDERDAAVYRAGEFLFSLLDPKRTPRVPREIRDQAGMVLRHYPLGKLWSVEHKH